jgi:hypothetical protein
LQRFPCEPCDLRGGVGGLCGGRRRGLRCSLCGGINGSGRSGSRRHRLRRRAIRIMLQLPRVADRPHRVVAIVEVDEGQLVGLTRPRHGRTVLGERLHAADEFRQLVVLLGFEIIEEDLRNARAVADERDRLAVRRPHRVEVLAVLPGDHRDGIGLEVEQVDLPFAELEQLEVGALSAIAHEGDLAPVR